MSGAAGNLKTYEERIVRDKAICGGEPVFRGTRVTLRTVLASLAAGDSAEEILTDFPSLKPEDVQAAIAFTDADALEGIRQGREDLKNGRVSPARKALETFRRKRAIPR
jgi:uncharacterized protein (DUF433 family)